MRYVLWSEREAVLIKTSCETPGRGVRSQVHDVFPPGDAAELGWDCAEQHGECHRWLYECRQRRMGDAGPALALTDGMQPAGECSIHGEGWLQNPCNAYGLYGFGVG